MKKLILIAAIAVCKTYAASDTLRVNIGTKSSVIFYAETPLGFKEIEKYDLNRLFKEVKQRSERNFNLNEEISLKEVDKDLKNLDNNKNLFAKNKNWYWNMNIGMGILISDGGVEMEEYQSKLTTEPLKIRGVIQTKGNPALNIGIGLLQNAKIIERRHLNFDLKYGLGLDLLHVKKQPSYIYLFNSEYFNKNQIWKDHLLTQNIFDELRTNFDTLSVNKLNKVDYYAPEINVTFIPTVYFKNKKGITNFNFGIGIKAGFVAIRNVKHLDYTQFPNLNYYFQKFNNSFVANVGYKKLNVFFQLKPNVGVTYHSKVITYNLVKYQSLMAGIKFGR